MKHYGLIGEKLSHSFSKDYFAKKIASANINATYENVECASIQHVKEVLRSGKFDGMNITIPYKESIIPFLDQIDPIASEVGAVNTIKNVNGKWIGYNTDVFGFKQMIKPFFKSYHERAIIFGTGGASKAVKYVLEKVGASVIFISRNPQSEFEFSYDEVNDIMLNSCYIIVNTTPLGMFPNINEELPIPYEFLNSKHLAIDLVYNPDETVFLKKAKLKKSWTLNGLTMLQQQAEKSWEIWRENI